MTGRVGAALLLATCAAGGCAAGAAGTSGGAGGRPPARVSAAEEWITIRDFRHAGAVAVSDRVLYLGSTAGLERWDTLREEWLSPLTSFDGLPDDHVTALAVDPLGSDVWIGTRRGLARLAFEDVVEIVWGPPPAPVSVILLDDRDGTVHALVAGAWWSGRGGALARSGGPPPGARGGPVMAADLDPAAVPWMDPFYARSEPFGGIVRLTQVDRDAAGDWYAGTWGDNGRLWRAVSAEWEPLYFGLAGAGGGPVVRAGDGLWLVPGGETGSPRAALAHAESGFERWSYVVPGIEPALATAVWSAGVAIGDTLLLAGDGGLAWGSGPEWRDAGRDDDVEAAEAVALDGAVVWVGTHRGLVAWDPVTGRMVAEGLRSRAVRAVAAAPDALFAGTDEGLWVARRSTPPGSPSDAASTTETLARVDLTGRAVRALVLHDGLLVVASDRGVEALDRATGQWRAASGPEVVALALASDGDNVWVGTEAGLARWRPATGEWRAYGSADGLPPGPVTHLLAEEDAVWASTQAGVTRFAWRAAEP